MFDYEALKILWNSWVKSSEFYVILTENRGSLSCIRGDCRKGEKKKENNNVRLFINKRIRTAWDEKKGKDTLRLRTWQGINKSCSSPIICLRNKCHNREIINWLIIPSPKADPFKAQLAALERIGLKSLLIYPNQIPTTFEENQKLAHKAEDSGNCAAGSGSRNEKACYHFKTREFRKA